jgi:ADP-heptose:LPS heptosyltransferase
MRNVLDVPAIVNQARRVCGLHVGSKHHRPALSGIVIRCHDALGHGTHRAAMLAWYAALRVHKAFRFPRGPQRILVVRLASLGDMIKVGAIAKALRARHPDARIEWLTSRAGRALAPYLPGFDAVWTLDQLDVLANESFDWAINLQRPDPPVEFLDGAKSYRDVLHRLSGIRARFRTGRRLSGHRDASHTLIFYCRNELEELQLTALLPLDWRLGTTTELLPPGQPSAGAAMSRGTRRRVALFIGPASASGHDGGRRSYSMRYLAELAVELSRRHEVWLFGQSAVKSEIERALLSALLAAQPNIRSVIDATDIGGLLAFLASVDAVVSCDSGPVHMALALRTPVVALYGNAGDFRLGGPRTQLRVRRINAFEPCFALNPRWKFFCDSCEERHWMAYGCDQKAEHVPLDRIPIASVVRHLDQMLGREKAVVSA